MMQLCFSHTYISVYVSTTVLYMKRIFLVFLIFLTIYTQVLCVIYQNDHQFMLNNLDTWILCHMTVTWNLMGIAEGDQESFWRSLLLQTLELRSQTAAAIWDANCQLNQTLSRYSCVWDNTRCVIEILLVTLTKVKLPDFIIDIPVHCFLSQHSLKVSLSKYSDATVAIYCRVMLTRQPSWEIVLGVTVNDAPWIMFLLFTLQWWVPSVFITWNYWSVGPLLAVMKCWYM